MPAPTYPTVEELLVVAPAGVAAKARAGFEAAWRAVAFDSERCA